MSETSLGHTPDGPWAFDAEVSACFEDMLERSIPNYRVMRDACIQLGAGYIQSNTAVLDLGCSQGGALDGLIQHSPVPDARYIGIEVSEPMWQIATDRFRDFDNVEIRREDLRSYWPDESPSVVLSVLTLQFIPIEYRQMIVQKIHDALRPGGVVILVEKCLGANAHLDQAMIDCYYDLKQKHGYSQDEIERKRLALEGVLVPVTARMNEEFLHNAGFRQVDCFWRWMNFAGWIARKQ